MRQITKHGPLGKSVVAATALATGDAALQGQQERLDFGRFERASSRQLRVFQNDGSADAISQRVPSTGLCLSGYACAATSPVTVRVLHWVQDP
jgi:hypothetical protein